MSEFKEKLLLDEFMDWGAEKLDKVTFPKGIGDVVDRPVYRATLGMLNNTLSKKVPDEFKDGFHAAQLKIITANYDDAAADAIGEAVEIIEASKLSDKVKGVLTSVLGLVKSVLGGLD
jgi:hypothetical protein